jgi:hypothetical protein
LAVRDHPALVIELMKRGGYLAKKTGHSVRL